MIEHVFLVNLSTHAGYAALQPKLCEALQEQACDLENCWPQGPDEVRVDVAQDAKSVPAPLAPGRVGVIFMVDSVQDPTALAYHEELPDGTPASYVGVQTVLDAGGTLSDGPFSVTQAASHEFCEMIADAATNRWMQLPDGTEQALEICDPVEGNAYAAENGIALSDFVTPDYFDPAADAKKTPLNRMGTLTSPFQVDVNGYAVIATVDGITETYGETYDNRRKALKRHPLSRRQKRYAERAPKPRELRRVARLDAPRIEPHLSGKVVAIISPNPNATVPEPPPTTPSLREPTPAQKAPMALWRDAHASSVIASKNPIDQPCPECGTRANASRCPCCGTLKRGAIG